MSIDIVKVISYITLVISVLLIIAGFCVPPTGIIDGSVLTAVGEIGLFTLIVNIPYYIEKAISIHFEKGDTKIDINK